MTIKQQVLLLLLIKKEERVKTLNNRERRDVAITAEDFKETITDLGYTKCNNGCITIGSTLFTDKDITYLLINLEPRLNKEGIDEIKRLVTI